MVLKDPVGGSLMLLPSHIYIAIFSGCGPVLCLLLPGNIPYVIWLPNVLFSNKTPGFCGCFRRLGVNYLFGNRERATSKYLTGCFTWKTRTNMGDRDGRGIRATSAGRFPDTTNWRSGTPSLYHDKCAPQIERVKSAPPRTYAQREYTKCDVVRNDEIWKNRCRNEGKMTRKWYVSLLCDNTLADLFDRLVWGGK